MKKKILIVEDEQHLLRQYSEVLREFGEIFPAANSQDVLSLIHQDMDLVILDIKLIGDPKFPQENAGMEILKVIKRELKLEVPVIIITAYSKEEVENAVGLESINIGAYDYEEKPIDLFSLRKVVEKALLGIKPGGDRE
jgi:DNA-binding NtrC family response regulator